MSRGGSDAYRRRHYGEVPADDAATFKAWVWPCGCVTQGARDGLLTHDCGQAGCYRRRNLGRRRIRL